MSVCEICETNDDATMVTVIDSLATELWCCSECRDDLMITPRRVAGAVLDVAHHPEHDTRLFVDMVISALQDWIDEDAARRFDAMGMLG